MPRHSFGIRGSQPFTDDPSQYWSTANINDFSLSFPGDCGGWGGFSSSVQISHLNIALAFVFKIKFMTFYLLAALL